MGAVDWDCMEKARHITEHDKYDNKATGFWGNTTHQPFISHLEDTPKHVMSHWTLTFLL